MAGASTAAEAVEERARQRTASRGGLLGCIARALGFVAEAGDADARERSRRTCCRAQGF
jgi:hypothetical protein